MIKGQLLKDQRADVLDCQIAFPADGLFQNGQIAAALESTGNQYLLEGYTELALQQYENALKQEGISETATSRLQARIKLIQPESR